MAQQPPAAAAAADPRAAAGPAAAADSPDPAGSTAHRAADPRDGRATAGGATAGGATAPPSGSLFGPLLGLAQQLLDDLRGALQARAHLFALEAQRAGLALVVMALFGVVAALLLVTAWFCLWALLIALAVSLGAPLWLVLLVALVLSLGAAWLLLRMVRAEARHLLFPASVRQLGRQRGLDGAGDGAAPATAAGAAE